MLDHGIGNIGVRAPFGAVYIVLEWDGVGNIGVITSPGMVYIVSGWDDQYGF